ncbi:MAG: hypothetical protein RL294_155 [Actinomycetota bacterium]
MSSAQERRNRQNVFTLIGALLASFGIVLVIVVISIRPNPTSRAEVDWHSVHNDAPNSVLLVDPTFAASDGDWWANRADYRAGRNPEWYIGFVTPTSGFVVVHEFLADVSPEVAEVLDDVTASPVVIDGSTWTRYDRSELENPGNYRHVYEITLPSGGILIVSGTAAVSEIELVASLALESVNVQVTGKG